MDENKRFVTGLDLGTENVRAVIATVSKDGETAIVGYNEGKSAGMRKGMPANLAGPAEAIDKMLGDAERMGGLDVRNAYVSINGSTVMSSLTEGMIAVGAADHEIIGEDLDRVEGVAVTGRIPANRDVLDVVPLEYALDGQGGVKDPLGMVGSRLEMRACVVSALTPNCENLRRATMAADVKAERLVPSAVAAAKAVLSDRQRENGVAVIDMGAATTSVAIYEEGDLQYVGVVPAGSNNITNDLAIMLAILSSFKNIALSPKLIAFGEVGLSGEVRSVSMAPQRVAEAAKLGFDTCILPKVCLKNLKEIEGIRLIGVDNIQDVIECLF